VRVRFKGKVYHFGGDNLQTDKGFLATEEQYANGLPSFAHLCDDGIIRRYHKRIGVRADLELVDDEPLPEPTIGAFFNTLLGKWEEPKDVDKN
jgi:hypothetical protein